MNKLVIGSKFMIVIVNKLVIVKNTCQCRLWKATINQVNNDEKFNNVSLIQITEYLIRNRPQIAKI